MDRVEELQGIDGSVFVPERLVQKIWLRREFADGARLEDGRSLEVIDPGFWNRGPGPDFLGARLLFGGETVSGDVEVHLTRYDWHAHGHATDPAYRSVVLHVVLFPRGGPPASTSRGLPIAELVLLPWLLRSLEESVADDVLERLAGKDADGLAAAWAARPRESVLAEVWDRAGERWERKLSLARVRLARLGWEESCHSGALEVLGYRANRAAMLAAATVLPWRLVCRAPPGLEAWWAAGGTRWVERGLRPANHPRVRLAQLEAWICARPDWPERAAGLADRVRGLRRPRADRLAAARRDFGGARERAAWIDLLTGNHLRGTRADNLIADHVLPLLAAAHPETVEGASAAFFLWWEGDHPTEVARVLQACRLADTATPRGNALVQGVLGALLDESARTAGGLAPSGPSGKDLIG